MTGPGGWQRRSIDHPLREPPARGVGAATSLTVTGVLGTPVPRPAVEAAAERPVVVCGVQPDDVHIDRGRAMTGPDDAFLAPDDALLDVPEALPPGTEPVEPPGPADRPHEDGVEDVDPAGG